MSKASKHLVENAHPAPKDEGFRSFCKVYNQQANPASAGH